MSLDFTARTPAPDEPTQAPSAPVVFTDATGPVYGRRPGAGFVLGLLDKVYNDNVSLPAQRAVVLREVLGREGVVRLAAVPGLTSKDVDDVFTVCLALTFGPVEEPGETPATESSDPLA